MVKEKCKFSMIIVPLVVLGTAWLGHYFTGQGLERYSALNLPSWIPSGGVISLTWGIIFVLFAISGIIFCRASDYDKRFGLTVSLFIDNLILNVLRSWLFFVKHLFTLAIVDMILLWAITVLLIIAAWGRSKWTSILLIPYAIWLIIAIVLAFSVSSLN